MVACKDCKHFRRDWSTTILSLGACAYDYARCARETVQDKVSGKIREKKMFCSIARAFESECGAEGKFFEGKK